VINGTSSVSGNDVVNVNDNADDDIDYVDLEEIISIVISVGV